MRRTQQATRLITGALALLTIALLTYTGCKKDEEASPSSTKTIVKYEIVSPAPTIPDSVLNLQGFRPYIIYSYDYGPFSLITESYKYSFTVWTKEIDITNLKRPFVAVVDTRSFVPVTTGEATLNIYVNSELKATRKYPVREFNGNGYGYFDLNIAGGNVLSFTIN